MVITLCYCPTCTRERERDPVYTVYTKISVQTDINASVSGGEESVATGLASLCCVYYHLSSVC